MKFILLAIIALWCTTHIEMYAQKTSVTRQDYPVIVDGKVLENPYVGGFNSPQPQNIDLNNDGILDLVIFDRDTEAVKTFLGKEKEGRIVYTYSPEYESIFPRAVNFIFVVDFNGDGVEDLFVGYNKTGIPGIHVYRGIREGNELRYELMKQASRDDNLLPYRLSSGMMLALNTSPIDLPAIVDVDNDGDIDILIFQPGSGIVYYYKNQAVEKGLGKDTLDFMVADLCYGKFQEIDFPEINLSPNPDDCASRFSGDIPVHLRHSGSTIVSLDLDGDGLNDLLIGHIGSSEVVALYNGGTEENAWMVDIDIHFPSYDVPIKFNEFLSVFTVDVDQDGKTDLLVAPNLFASSQTMDNMHYYKQEERNGKPAFIFQERDFLYKDQIDLSSHAVPVTADINGNGLLDIVVGTYGNYIKGEGRSPRLYYFENTGTKGKPQYTLKDDDFLKMSMYGDTSWGFAPTFGDLDGDGDLDLIVGDYQGYLYYFENIAGPGKAMEFAEAIPRYMGIKVSHYAIPQIVDVNKDGMGDLIIGEQNGSSGPDGACGSIAYYENQGVQGTPQFNPDVNMRPNTPCYGNVFTRYLNTSRAYTSPQLLDINGELRLLTGDYVGNISYYAATEDPEDEYALVEKHISGVEAGKFVHPHMANLDDDDYLELIVGTLGGGLIIYKTNWNINGDISGVKEMETAEISVYPNPATQTVTIELEASHLLSEVRIYNAVGELMKTYADVETSVKCDVSNYPSGVYVIQVWNPDYITTGKVVIQH